MREVAAALMLMLPCERPPIEYQGQAAPAIVVFATPQEVDDFCRGSTGIDSKDYILLACTDGEQNIMLLPDPCLFQDAYAQLVCHEMAHLKRADGSAGWRHTTNE